MTSPGKKFAADYWHYGDRTNRKSFLVCGALPSTTVLTRLKETPLASTVCVRYSPWFRTKLR